MNEDDLHSDRLKRLNPRSSFRDRINSGLQFALLQSESSSGLDFESRQKVYASERKASKRKDYGRPVSYCSIRSGSAPRCAARKPDKELRAN